MIRDALYLARMDAAHLLRRRETLLWTFVMPVIFFYFIGAITGNSYTAPKDALAVNVPPDAGFLADQLIARLNRAYRVALNPDPAQLPRFVRKLTIPSAFTDSVLAGKPMTLQFGRTGEDMSADYDRVRLYRAVYTTLADLIVVSGENPQVSKEAFEKLAAEPRTLTLNVRAAGHRLQAPTGFEQSVPGTMVMFTLLVLFTTGGVSLTLERNNGILRRLASSPMSRASVVLGKWGARMALGIIQNRLRDDHGNGAVPCKLGAESADDCAGDAGVRIARGRSGNAAGQLWTNGRTGDRIGRDGKQRFGWAGWLLVAD